MIWDSLFFLNSLILDQSIYIPTHTFSLYPESMFIYIICMTNDFLSCRRNTQIVLCMSLFMYVRMQFSFQAFTYTQLINHIPQKLHQHRYIEKNTHTATTYSLLFISRAHTSWRPERHCAHLRVKGIKRKERKERGGVQHFRPSHTREGKESGQREWVTYRNPSYLR